MCWVRCDGLTPLDSPTPQYSRHIHDISQYPTTQPSNHRWGLHIHEAAFSIQKTSSSSKVQNIVTCILTARQWLGKHASKLDRLFSMCSASPPFLCNGAVNTPKTIWDKRRRYFPWGPCKAVINNNSIEQNREENRIEFETPACRDMSLELN
jgi:hypothetical protein